jgi:hypothetical protein
MLAAFIDAGKDVNLGKLPSFQKKHLNQKDTKNIVVQP